MALKLRAYDLHWLKSRSSRRRISPRSPGCGRHGVAMARGENTARRSSFRDMLPRTPSTTPSPASPRSAA